MSENHKIKLPNLFLIGAAKCGTTSLAASLKRHPEIYVPITKEPHHFDLDQLQYVKNINNYSALYEKSIDSRYLLDATPSYISYPEMVIPRIQASLAGREKIFIAIVREPASRAYSHYMHLVRSRGLEKSFFELFEADRQGHELRSPSKWLNIYSDGLYGEHLKLWKERLGVDLHVFLYEELISDPRKVFCEIDRILGIDSIANYTELEKTNVMSTSYFPSIARLANTDNIVRKVAGKIITSKKWRIRISRALRKLNRKPLEIRKTPMDTSSMEDAKLFYKNDVLQLKSLFPDLEINKYWGYDVGL